MVHRRRRSDIGWILRVLRGYCSIVILRVVLLRVERRVVRIHVRIVHLRLRVLGILVVRPPPTHIWRHALPCRQMTTVHPTGLGISPKPTATEVGGGAARCRASGGANAICFRFSLILNFSAWKSGLKSTCADALSKFDVAVVGSMVSHEQRWKLSIFPKIWRPREG
jgi:hypothetical protein